MENKQDKTTKTIDPIDGCAGVFIAIYCIVTILGLVLGIFFEAEDLLGISVFMLLFGALLGIGALSINRSMKKQKKEAQRQTDALHRQMRAGEWAFPVDTFLAECTEKGIAQLTTDYEIRKATLIAKGIVEKAGMPQDYIPAYCSENKVRGYFAAAIKQKEQKEQQDRAAYERKYKTPQKHALTKEEQEYRVYADKAREASPQEKREMAIRYDLYRAKEQLADIEEQRKHAGDLEMAMVRASYQPTTDWATMGGIASAIAGPAAGAVVASQTIAENQAIEQQNAANMRAAVAIGNQLRDATPSAKPVKERIAALQKELEEAPYKVVFEEYDTAELFSALSIAPKPYAYSSSLAVSLQVTNRRKNDDPQVKKAIDGSFWMRAYCDDILLDTVCVVLPRDGVACDKGGVWKTVTLAQYMIEGDKRNYRFEFEPIRLWMIEQ